MMQGGMIKVHINLGAGESEVSSPRNLRLDDLRWHNVKIKRKDADLQLLVDNIHVTRVNLPGRYYELNIHYGINLGGMGDPFGDLFFGNQESFRGCLEDVVFNGIDVLGRAKSNQHLGASSSSETSQGQGVAQLIGITWGCSDEFDATTEAAISFIDKNAFISFPNWISRTGAMVNFKVKTASSDAILFYNTGPASNKDFVALEILEGAPRLLVDQGNGVLHLRSPVKINDGRWHQVKAQFSPSYLELAIDNEEPVKMRPSPGENRHIDLSGLLYFGGLEAEQKPRAFGQGVRSATQDSYFQGCLQNLELDGRSFGLPEVKETMGIAADCVWSFPCLESSPCGDNSQCVQQGTQGYDCRPRICMGDHCDEDVLGETDPDLPSSLVSLKLLEVDRGGRTLITSDHLRITFNYSKFEIRESGVLFHVVERPRNGKLDVSVWEKKTESIFTLLDLNTDKVYYVHDGSSAAEDTIVLELELTSASPNRLPAKLRNGKRFVFRVSVLHSRDPPEARLKHPMEPMSLAQGTRKRLPNDFIIVSDTDSKPAEVIFSVIESGQGGKLQNERLPAKDSISEFTLEDLQEGRIFYTDLGVSSESQFGLQVSDADADGNVVTVRVQSFRLAILEVNNTGLSVATGSSAKITSFNLTFTTNAPDQGLVVRFDVQEGPRFGRLERLRGNGRWVPTKRFYSRQLEKEKIRYVHTRGNPFKDSFRFTATANEEGQDSDSHHEGDSESHVFHIDFITLQVQPIRNNVVQLINVQETVITDTYLLYQTFPRPTPDAEIFYSIEEAPSQGVLLLATDSTSSDSVQMGSGSGRGPPLRKLRTGARFSQVDLLSGHLMYRLARKAFQPVDDSFRFVVQTEEQKSAVQTFNIRHVPGDTDVEITLERLEVEEGAKKTISGKYLNIRASDIRSFVFNVTKSPQHGQLDVLGRNRADVMRANASFFTSDEIAEERLVYRHDDSESRRDSFHFLVTSAQHRHDFQYLAVFHIHVILRNDQTPTRVIDKVFQVVEGGQKLLTSKDLKFIDLDIDTRPEDIKYNHHAIPNGELVLVDNPSEPVFQFTQKDLDDDQILFKHLGANFGRIVFWVTDGQYFVSTELKVRASPPFVRLTNNSGVVVQRGDSAFLTAANLSVETNMNARSKNILFHVGRGPRFGALLKDDVPVTEFTEADLIGERIEYRSSADKSGTVRDEVRFSVKILSPAELNPEAAAAETEGVVTFFVFPESYWEPLIVASNNSLLVEESTSIALTQYDLQVITAKSPDGLHLGEISPKDIMYSVTSPPQHGYLEIDPPIYPEMPPDVDSMVAGNADMDVITFSQDIINEGRLHYIQSISNQSQDSFSFKVTNGISSLDDLVFHFTILPKTLYIETRGMTVTEGESVPLLPSNLHVITSYYEDKIEDYLIVDPPTSGKLVSTSVTAGSSRQKSFGEGGVTIFSVEDLRQGTIQYSHNGNDTVHDAFTLVARTASKTSAPAIVRIRIIPVNDETPIITVNSGMEVWAGGTVVMSPNMIAASDADSPAEALTFETSEPDCGFFSLTQSARTPVLKFSQEDLTHGKVLFTHTGGRRGTIRVTVSDGLNTAQPEIFYVKIKDLFIHLVRNEALDVFPMMMTPLTSQHLLVAPSDLSSRAGGATATSLNGREAAQELGVREVIYRVKKPSSHGRLLYREPDSYGKALVEIRNFTQSQVNSSRIYYEHHRPFSNLTIYDAMNLEAMTPFAVQRLDITFHVRISVTAMIPGGIDRFIGTDEITLEEGKSIPVYDRDLNTTGVLAYLRSHRHQGGTSSMIAPRLKLQLSRLPEHGYITISGDKARLGQTFLQSDVDRGFVVYNHDHSDSRRDAFGVALYLVGDRSEVYGDGRGKTGDVLLYNGLWNITIIPVNDQPFRLITNEPSMTVVQRQRKAITRDDLLTEDPDNPPSEIYYDIINSPSSGHLVFAENLTATVSRFTQADIDAERVIYVHDGTDQPVEFYFRVSDIGHKPVFRHFRIHTFPLELKLTQKAPIAIQQGTDLGYITSANMATITNGAKSLTTYTVTHQPKGGQIYMNDAVASRFTQVNVDNDEVVFMQTDMSLANDSFFCTITNQDATLYDQRFDVVIVPLVKQFESFNAILGKKTPITQKNLDSTQLSGLTNSNPVYFLLDAPNFGRIMRVVKASARSRKGRSLRDKEVWQFSHEDIKNEVIHFVTDPKVTEAMSSPESLASRRTLNDTFVFKLVAPGVQPAIGTFQFTIIPQVMLPNGQPNPITEDVTTGMNGGPPGSVPGNPDEHLRRAQMMHGTFIVAITILVAILLVVILIILGIKCRRDHKDKEAAAAANALASVAASKYSSDSLSTHHTHFGTARRAANTAALVAAQQQHHQSNGHLQAAYEARRLSTTDYENGILPIPPSELMTPKKHISNGNNTLPKHTLAPNNHQPGIAASDSDSWGVESSRTRSRETSPASSIPPGMAPFRVIPLCDSESSGTHLSDPNTAFTTLGAAATTPFSSNGTELNQGLRTSGSEGMPYGGPFGSEAGSDQWPSSSGTPVMNSHSGGSNGSAAGGGSNSLASSGQPLLRRNQYWV